MRIAGVPEGSVESPGFSLQSGQVWGCCPASDPAETRGVKACSLAEVATWSQLFTFLEGRMPGMLGGGPKL